MFNTYFYFEQNNTMFQNELRQMNVPPQLSRYAPQTYDAVWAIALAMRGAEEFWRNISSEQPKLDRFDYTRYDMAMEFLHQFSQLKFLGVSVRLPFSLIKFNLVNNIYIHICRDLYLLMVLIV